ncbi:hypothetical protein [Pedobacter sp. Leaf132]|uniref:hypothetical protein n=1 Tax=Pedobacter sp. Leaf132 TaxID=2876557 RepID=UPI001E56CA3D|nr:hypothetical protein [Pedobacter sp. Leaf132]
MDTEINKFQQNTSRCISEHFEELCVGKLINNMDWNNFFIGIGFLVVAYLIFRGIKKGPSSEKNNWEGPTLSLYVQGRGTIIVCLLCGIVPILKALSL